MSHPKVSFIFIHGFCFGPSLWSDLIPHFEKYSEHLVNYSLYNQPHHQGFHVDRTIDDLKNIVLTRPDHKWILVGHSLGGYLSLEMIHKHQELISACILINSHLHMDTENKKRIRSKQIRLIERRGLQSYLRVFYENIDPLNARKWHRQFGSNLKKQMVLDHLAYMRDREVKFTSVREFTGHKYLGIIHGRDDNIISNKDIYSKFYRLNQGQIEVIPGDHLSPLNQVSSCLKALQNMWPYLSFSLK